MKKTYKGFMRFLSLALALILIVSVFPEVAKAESFSAMVTVSKMNVYLASDMKTKIGTLSKYAIVDVLQYSGSTAKIQKGKNIGYAYIKDMTRVDDIAVDAYINAACRVYASASTKSKSTSVRENMSVRLLAVNGSWAMIENKGNIAYCQKKYVTEKLDENSIVYETVPARAKVKTYVYKTHSRTAATIGALQSGATVTVYAYNDVWARVKISGKYGFCLIENLEKAASVQTPVPTVTPANTPAPTKPTSGNVIYEEFTASVNASSLRVYASADKSSKYLGSMKRGTKVTVHAYDGYWAYVSLNGRYGYCAKSYLARIPEEASTPVPTPSPTPAVTPSQTPAAEPDKNETSLPVDQAAIFEGDYTNEEKIFLFFTKIAGYSDAAACGILANMKKESGFRPNAVSSGGGYHGLCQWSKTRFGTISAYAEKHGFDPYSLEGQLNYMMNELATTAYGKKLASFENTAQGAYDAGYYFCYNYERPSNKAAKSVERGNLAKNTYWAKYGE